MKRRAFTLGLVCFCVAAADDPREKIEGTKLDALLAELARVRKGVKTLRADFTQERAMKLLATTVKSTGQLGYVAPDRLRWELAPPDDVIYWVGPEGLSYRTKSSGATVPASGANVARGLADLRALLAGDLAALGDRYVLSATRGASDVEIRGDSKDKSSAVKAFAITIDKGLVLPIKARLVEGKADTVDLVFTNAAANVPIDPATMKP